MRDGVVGFRSRTGRATAIVLSGSRRSPAFVRREEVVLVDPAVLPDEGPYHTVMHLPWSDAIVAIQPLIDSIEEIARNAVQRIVDDMSSNGVRIRAVGVAGSPPRNLETIGNFHIRAHAAEGTLFRRVLEMAAAASALPCHPLTDAEAKANGARMKSALDRIGVAAGRPWRSDERFAATAALIALGD